MPLERRGKRESLTDNSACLFVCFTAQKGEREGAAIKSPLAQPDLCGKSFINNKITQRRRTTATIA